MFLFAVTRERVTDRSSPVSTLCLRSFYSLLRESGSLTGAIGPIHAGGFGFYSLLRESESLIPRRCRRQGGGGNRFYSLLRESGSLTRRLRPRAGGAVPFLFAVTRERVTDHWLQRGVGRRRQGVSIGCYARAGH